MIRIAFCASALTTRRLPHFLPSNSLLGNRWGIRVLSSPFPVANPAVLYRACASSTPAKPLPVISESDSPPIAQDAIQKLRSRFEAIPAGDIQAVEQLVTETFQFSLDRFQTGALRALAKGESVVLSAPTGAGKTIVGEMAVYLALCRGLRVFYTTPLKALSNQKFYDFKKQFGERRVGLLTGDVTVNRDADVVVMTTEVYRNMLYAESVEGIRGDGGGTERLFAVVFDEFHYLNDRDRGTVWEESVINSPAHVLLVALSATMSNTGDVKEWFRAVQGETALIESHVRPVPLKFAYCDHDGMTPLFSDEKVVKKRRKGFARGKKKEEDKGEVKLHPKLLRKLKEGRTERERERGLRRGVSGRDGVGGDIGKGEEKMKKRYGDIVSRKGKYDRYAEIPSFPFVVRTLRRKSMLPCIVFIFSRAGCDRAAVSAAKERDGLVTENEENQIQERLDIFSSEHPGLVQQDRFDLALQGIASHHAGLMPLWKVCVEEMFQDGLIKVIFATETLAAGINMPARTTVISSLSKRAGEEGFVNLTTSQVLQMGGRAGRRGKDVVGHSVVLRSRKEGALEAFKVVTADVDALQSKFTPNYGMVLNLLAARPLSEAKKLVDRSFGNFLRQKQIREQYEGKKKKLKASSEDMERISREKEALELVLEECKRVVGQVEEKELRSYMKGLERVKAEKRALSYLVEQSTETDSELIEETLMFAPTGTRVLLKQRGKKRSTGAERRRKRRDYSAAIAAAGEGDLGVELKEFYLGGTDWDLEDIDDDEEDDEEEENVIEGVLLDMHSDSAGILPMFAAVDGNGDLRIFNHNGVSRLFFDMETINVENIVEGWGELVLPGRSCWESIGGDQFSAKLPSELECVVESVREWREERKLEKEKSDDGEGKGDMEHPEVEAQKERVKYAKQRVRDDALHEHKDLGMILGARRAISKIEGTLRGEIDPFGSKRRKGRRNKKIYDYEEEEEEGKNTSWDEFMGIGSVLQQYGFLDENYDVTSLGGIGAKVRSDNELWTSLILLEPSLENVSPIRLGAILGATQMESGRNDVFMDYEISEETKEMLNIAYNHKIRLQAIQAQFGVNNISILLDGELMGLVEKWATGISWMELLRGTSLQEGDACRILRRVLDLLRQIQYLPIISENLKRNAKRAISLLDRFPVTDDTTYVIRDNERLVNG